MGGCGSKPEPSEKDDENVEMKLRICIIGEPGVGKTTTINEYIGEAADDDDMAAVSIRQKEVSLMDGDTFYTFDLEIIDCKGVPEGGIPNTGITAVKAAQTRNTYYSGADLIILMYDIAKPETISTDVISKWQKELNLINDKNTTGGNNKKGMSKKNENIQLVLFGLNPQAREGEDALEPEIFLENSNIKQASFKKKEESSEDQEYDVDQAGTHKKRGLVRTNSVSKDKANKISENLAIRGSVRRVRVEELDENSSAFEAFTQLVKDFALETRKTRQ